MKLSDFALQEAVHISTEQAWHLFDHLQSELGNSMLTPDRFGKAVQFNRDVAMNLALQQLSTYKLNQDGTFDRANMRFAAETDTALSKLRLLFGSHNNEIGQFVEWFDKLVELGMDLPKELQVLRQAAIDLDGDRHTWEATLQMVDHITRYVDNLISLLRSEKTGDYEKSIIRASLKQLGVFA